VYDIAIVGAGPAGNTLARLIGAQFNTVIIDKRNLTDFPAPYGSGKCCGGLLAPDAQAMLAKMHLSLPHGVLAEPQIFVVRAIDFQRNLERCYQRYYINMDRWQFDRWLLSLVPRAVDIMEKTSLKSFKKMGNHYTLTLSSRGQHRTVKARVLIGADGAFSRVRKIAFCNRPFPKKYISIQQWVQSDDDQSFFSSIFDSDITDYYSWTIPKRDAMIIGTAVEPGSDACDKFLLLKSKLQTYGYQFGDVLHREGAHILRVEHLNQISLAKDSIALLGEAAGFISSSSAEGFSYAFRSALMLAKALRPGLQGFEHRYRAFTGPLRTNIASKILKSRVIYNPHIRSIIMRTGINSMPIRYQAAPISNIEPNYC